MQNIWKWTESELHDGSYIEGAPVSQQDAWWERLVAWLLETEGLLSLY